MNDLLVSVIIPTYNREKLVQRALKSVLAQTYPTLDVIIVDDASTDDTRERIMAFQEIDQRIRYIRHEQNRGAQAARNTGFRAANGSIIAFLDSDNEWLPQKIEKQSALLTTQTFSPGVVYCGFVRVGADGQMINEYVPRYRGNVYKQVLHDWLTDTSTLVIRREVLGKIGGVNEGLLAYHEWDLCIQLARECEFDYVPESLTIYHEHNLPSISKDLMVDALGYQKIVEQYKDDILRENGRRALSSHYLKIARLFILSDQFTLAKTFFAKAVVSNPLNLKALQHYCATLIGRKTYNFLHSLYQNRK